MADQQTKDEPTDKAEPDLLSSILDELPIDRLKSELQEALTAVAERAIDAAGDKVSDLTSKLTDVADGGSLLGGGGLKGGMLTGALKGGLSSVKDKAKDALTGGGGGGGGKPAKATKATNIIESIDVGVPVDVAYDQWTQFQDFPSFMKKVESVEQQADEKITWKAKIVWSHRTWEATILEQVPDERIVWRSKGEKGHVDGSVTFHELAPNLTRILVVLEYYPQGLFERVGNIWRAQGRRARLELKHFRRHVMTRTILNADDLEGWRGEIHDSQVTRGPDEEEPSDEYDEDTADDQDDETEDEYDEYDDSDESDDSDDSDDSDESDDSDGAESDGDADEDELGDEYDDEEDVDDEADEDDRPARRRAS
ncbi:MAG TPA: SRPBCC family protein [Kribbella sp.]|nr:SRPBCC family protein [Kribbella sp.]